MSIENTRTTRVAYILDKSGSMGVCREQAIQGTNDYFAALAAEDPDTRVSVTLFDTDVYHVISGVPVREITQLTAVDYVPNGGTALFDAVGSTIVATENEQGEDDIVMVVIFTDGEENSSCELSREQLVSMIKDREESRGWNFVFLGANQDAWTSAESIGISQSRSANYPQFATRAAMAKSGRLHSKFLKQAKESVGAPMEFHMDAQSIDDIDENDQDLPNQWKRRGGKK